MTKIKYFGIFLLCLFLIPSIVSADTLLDREDLRDVSWFDENTYETTEIFNIDNEKKIVGLLYEVNVNGYTFENKIIKITLDRSNYCVTQGDCGIYIYDDEFEWIPISSIFKGTFDTRLPENYYSFFETRDMYYDLYLYSDQRRIDFLESKSCKRFINDSDGNSQIIEEEDCTIPVYKIRFNLEKIESSKGTYEFYGDQMENAAYGGYDITVRTTPKYGYEYDKMRITTESGNVLESHDTSMIMPYEDGKLEVFFKRKKYNDLQEINNYEHFVFEQKEPSKLCEIVSGNGKDVGSEIKCGTEHFYVLDNSKDEIKMLAKYNLYGGIIIFKEKIEKAANDTRTDEQYCQDLAESKGGEVKSDSFYNDPGYCFYKVKITTNRILQNEDAISAHWDESGNYVYPQIGDYYIYNKSYSYSSDTDGDFYNHIFNRDLYDGYFHDLFVNFGEKTHDIGNSLKDYFNVLTEDGYGPKKIDLLSLNDINKVVKLNNSSIDYESWYDNMKVIDSGTSNEHAEFGFVNNLLKKQHSWIYGTTYWLRSGFSSSESYSDVPTTYLFVDTAGGICNSGTETFNDGGMCNFHTETLIGCGVRPVVTIPNILEYDINVVTNGNGTIEAVRKSVGGKNISFSIKSKPGYKLYKLVVSTDNGEEIEFEKGDLIDNGDGTLSIDDSVFVMPFESVTIEAEWLTELVIDIIENVTDIENIEDIKNVEDIKDIKNQNFIEDIKNPDTSDKVLLLIVLLMITLGICLYLHYKEKVLKKQVY